MHVSVVFWLSVLTTRIYKLELIFPLFDGLFLFFLRLFICLCFNYFYLFFLALFRKDILIIFLVLLVRYWCTICNWRINSIHFYNFLTFLKWHIWITIVCLDIGSIFFDGEAFSRCLWSLICLQLPLSFIYRIIKVLRRTEGEHSLLHWVSVLPLVFLLSLKRQIKDL